MSSTSDFSKSPNLHLMIPFVRTRWELEECLALVDSSPLGRQRGLHRWVMAEVPSVVHWLLGPHGRHRFSHTESSVLVARA